MDGYEYSNPLPVTEPAPAPEPAATPEPIIEKPIDTFEKGGELISPSKLQMAHIFVLGIVGASFLYGIYYYKTRLDSLSTIDKLRKDLDEINEKLKLN